MTNPTPPLTIEELMYRHIENGGERVHLIKKIKEITDREKSELVAEKEYLKRLLSRMSWYANIPNATGIDEVDDKQDKEWQEFQNALDGMKKGPLLFELQAEVERFKKQLSSIVDTCNSHRRMGAGGCDAMSEGRRQAKSELAKQVLAIAQPPKEGV